MRGGTQAVMRSARAAHELLYPRELTTGHSFHHMTQDSAHRVCAGRRQLKPGNSVDHHRYCQLIHLYNKVSECIQQSWCKRQQCLVVVPYVHDVMFAESGNLTTISGGRTSVHCPGMQQYQTHLIDPTSSTTCTVWLC